MTNPFDQATAGRLANNSVLRPLSLQATLAARKPATSLQAFHYSREAASACLESLTGLSLFSREPGKTGPVCDCPAYQATARVFTASELEAAAWIAEKGKPKVMKPARKSSRLARLAQRFA